MLDIHEDSGQVALHAAGLYREFHTQVHPGGEAMRIVDPQGAVRLAEEDDGTGGRWSRKPTSSCTPGSSQGGHGGTPDRDQGRRYRQLVGRVVRWRRADRTASIRASRRPASGRLAPAR
jgi:hypothetical protein